MPKNEKVIYRSEKITPEQEALLSQPNSGQYPTEGELSAGKDTPNNSNSQEAGSELPANTDFSLRVDRDQLRAERERRKAAEKEAKQARKETSKLLAKVA